MANKMLIDASHPEETRVVVLRGNRVEEFDFESANKKQLRGNIYLAKVTRVEPSLQAAFVDYGGNRHGFLAFSEIHPDYYQIPVVDRQALLEEEALAQRDEEPEDGRHARRSRRHRRNGDSAEKRRVSRDETIAGASEAEFDAEAGDRLEGAGETEAVSEAAGGETSAPVHEAAGDDLGAPRAGEAAEPDFARAAATEPKAGAAEGDESETEHAAPHRLATDPEGFAVVDDEEAAEEDRETAQRAAAEAAAEEARVARLRPERVGDDREDGQEDNHDEGDDESDDDGEEEAEQVEQLGGDAMEEVPMRAHRSRRQYKIQEVIKRRQVLLVQVVKEERGNKGAALTTYLSLAGRYSVLMPNTARGGGISRKITDAGDRQRLKAIAQELEVPEGMGVILRTAGAARTKAEVKRDFEYLLRMWETVREMTLKSTAPALVYEEGSLVKRAIRDLYNKDIDEVTVSGENGYRDAKDFMRMLMPSHAKNVHLYREPQPIFAKHGVESQLDAMFSNQVTLKSGGYLVINQTEALVAIDVNSGRSTREHNIEDTALRTNLEAADEIARQLRLRDLAGLIVVDFIDMEETRNNRSVERRLKEALKNDRARIQIGRISHFGLLEMSRQRMRTGVLEGSTVVCPHCAGAGMVRSTSSIALHVLRLLEDALIKSASHNITVRTRTEVALYILNQKRSNLRDLERRFGVSITIAADDSLTGASYHAMERGEPATGVVEVPRLDAPRPLDLPEEEEESFADDGLGEGDEDGEAQGEDQGDAGESDANRKRRRRRRRRGRGSEREATGIAPGAPQPSDDGLAFLAEMDVPAAEAGGEAASEPEEAEESAEGRDEGEPRREGRRRRPRRRSRAATAEPVAPESADGEWVQTHFDELPLEAEAAAAIPPAEAPVLSNPEAGETRDDEARPTMVVASEPVAPEPGPEAISQSRGADEPEAVTPESQSPDSEEGAEAPESVASPDEPPRPKRTGWWQRAKASLRG